MHNLSWRLFLRNRRFAGLLGITVVFKRYLRAVTYILNLHTLIMLAISIVSVYVCLVLDLRWNMVG
jgi:hypothetical protein